MVEIYGYIAALDLFVCLGAEKTTLLLHVLPWRLFQLS